MNNCTDHHTGAAVARVTKDRAARLHLPSTVTNQLGRRRQLLTIAQWNVRTLLDREGADRPERRTALVAMELAKYNIDIAALYETRFSVWYSQRLGILFLVEWKTRRRKKGGRSGLCYQKEYRHKADRNATANK